ncbi:MULTISPECIES: CDP-glycerol glycerophosphotransferase family protein [Kitasatospora]|uniref:Putative glycerophosphotransferase n=1 Tax=Kitasatospora setae (strain ATCC 33774 / DSM 43861 / JCM 3304 / KCC A-0304 / NBRC 14216 / KM-6054) TaxID=452652 RepID=E4NCD1_KITSK|nr:MULTISPECIES: CDP-glycerol glycerophosphotransferase family protein [Kitasatospora]BAJ28862.1 putative glycerophosphotransferase [Kitasatospora setae KM-6054]
MPPLARHRTPPGSARPAEPPAALAALREAAWDGGALVLHGEGRMAGMPGDRPGRTRVVLELRPLDGSRRTAVRLRTVPRYLPEATDDSGQSAHALDWTGFTARLDPAALRPGPGPDGTVWRVEAAVTAGRLLARAPLAAHWCGSGEYPPAGWSADGLHLAPHTLDGTLHLTARRPAVRVTSCRARPDGFELRGTATGPGGGPLLLRHRDTGELIQTQAHWRGDEFTALVGTVPRPSPGHWDAALALPAGPAPLLLRAPLRGTAQLPLSPPLSPSPPRRLPAPRRELPAPDRALPDGTAPPSAPPGAGPVLYAKQLADDRLQFCVQPAEPRVDLVVPGEQCFELAGEYPGAADAGPLELVLRHAGDGRERRAPVRPAAGGRFGVRLPLAPAGPDGVPRPLGKGVWEALLRPVGPAGAPGVPVRLHPAVLPLLPARARVGDKSFLLQRRWHDTLIVDSLPVLSAVERSAHRQHLLRAESYPAARRRPLRDAVLYDVFGGRGYACNPRAVHAELARRGGLEHLWVVEDGQERPPAGARAVRQWSPEWYEALATCRYLVGNTHFPEFLRRREGQVVAQLWHGTPLKRIAHRMPPGWASADGYLERLEREVRQWSLLLSPSPFATPELRAAFRYRGEVLEAGYPRTDRLARPDPAEAAAIRRRLRLPPGRRVVLYAPTWRDDRPGAGGRHAFDLRIDLAAARAALGRDHVLLLRPHVHVGGVLPDDDFVRDVADHPDVQDLLLVADVLVTDYSSVMFDFAVTGRPMVFFAYDLEHYRDVLRGFTFDFEALAPGPLARTSAGLVAALRDLDPARYREARRVFRERFCPLDDGGAAARVADRLLALGAGGG